MIFLIDHSFEISNTKELSDLSGIPQFKVSLALQRLEKKKLIEIKSKKRGMFQLSLLPEASDIIRHLNIAHEDFNHTRFENFSEEEKETYISLSHRMDENIQTALWKKY